MSGPRTFACNQLEHCPSSYLADKGQFDEKLYPKAIEARARVDEFLEWQHLNIRLACSLFFRDAWLFPINGLAPKPKPEQIKQLVEGVETNLGLLELLFWKTSFSQDTI